MFKCAECGAEIHGIGGQIGSGKGARTLCLKHYRLEAKNPPPLPTDIIYETQQDGQEGTLN